jgi:SAM-dependent methyltransferase
MRVPPYFDLLIDGFKAGRTGRHVHLGYWDAAPPPATPCTAAEFEAAQARLCNIVINLADLNDGQSVLDVGCGFGGTLAAVDDRWQHMRLVGLNIDRRQLDICRTLTPHRTNSLSLVMADADAMPLRPAAFDRLVCLEAMFHFPSRIGFLRQAADALHRCRPPTSCPTLDRHRGEMVDQHQDGQQHEPDSRAPADQLFLDRQQRLDRSIQQLLSYIRLQHRGFLSRLRWPRAA